MKKMKIAFLLVSILPLTPTLMSAQNTSQAVMQVRVEVISGAQITQLTNSDISDQIQADVNGGFAGNLINLGSFTLITPEGVQFSARVEKGITFNDKSDNRFEIYTKADQIVTEAGKTEINITGTMAAGMIKNGQYSGNQITVIEYY
jgi:hypothetical protein